MKSLRKSAPRHQHFLRTNTLASWVGVCPGDEESAGVSRSHRSPKGNRNMRRLLNQCANAAVKLKGSIFQILYRRLSPRLGHNQTIWAVAHRLCWMILHRGVRYQERGPAVNERFARAPRGVFDLTVNTAARFPY